MKKFLILLAFVVTLNANNVCRMDLQNSQKYLKGMMVSLEDGDKVSHDLYLKYFLYWSRQYIINGCDVDGSFEKSRREVIKLNSGE